MRKLASLVVVAITLFALVGSVFAQEGQGERGQRGQRGERGQRGQGGPGGPGGPGGFGRGMMGGPGMGGMLALISEEGRKDLEITDQQRDQIREAFQSMRPRDGQGPGQGPGQRNFRDMSPEEREKAMETLRVENEKRQTEFAEKVGKILSPTQMEKLQTRTFQAGRWATLSNSPFAQAALKLTPEQKEKIRAMERERFAAMRPPQGAERPDFQNMSDEQRQKLFSEMRTRAEESQKKFEESVKGILTDEQKSISEKILGETPTYIKEAQERRMQGPGGPGGERGRRGERGGDRPEYRPGADSWQPGQGNAPQRENRERRRGGFPRGNNN